MNRDSKTCSIARGNWTAVFAVCAVTLVSSQALAQGVYRIVGPDGRVTYSDQPPASHSNAAAVGTASNAAASANAQLPLALRQVVGRYPVTLYTSKECAPCNTGRNLLSSRGIPFNEKTVNSNEDIDAFKRLSGDLTIPMLSIGSQRLKGFSDSEWTQYLNAAGYPQQSALPPSYRRPPAAPLVEAKTVVAPAKANTADTAPAEPQVVPPVSNPAGIRF